MAAAETAPTFTEDWNASLCGCFEDCGICCKTFFCPCCVYGDIIEALHGGEAPKSACKPCCSFFWCMLFFCNFAGCISAKGRRGIREKYNLAPICGCCGCPDCCASFWCCPCALCQGMRELKSRPLTVWPKPPGQEEATYVPPNPETMPTV